MPEHEERKREWADDVATEAAATSSLDSEDDDPSAASILLVVRRKEGTEVVALPADGATIGRARESTIAIDEASVSRNHARVYVEGHELVVEDFGSRNGTAVDGVALTHAKRALASGATLRVGSVTIVVARTTHVEAPPEPSVLEGRQPPAEVVGDLAVAHPNMTRVFDLVRRVARTTTSVLVLGETGVGKEVIAEQVHLQSPRARGPLVRVNCGAIPETLLESELFGHEKGAFTGADRKKVGYVEAADGGSLFLDEIGELAASAQVKLLRVLEGRVVQRVGGVATIPVDVRLICATHRDLQALVEESRFRADLYYRVSPFVIHIPPLRERLSEIPVLVALFARRFAAQMGERPATFDDATLAAMARYAWPGNVRELRNVVEHALVMSEGRDVRPEHLPTNMGQGSPRASAEGMRHELAEIERARIFDALATTNGNQTKAAELLGISRRALLYKLDRYRRQP